MRLKSQFENFQIDICLCQNNETMATTTEGFGNSCQIRMNPTGSILKIINFVSTSHFETNPKN